MIRLVRIFSFGVIFQSGLMFCMEAPPCSRKIDWQHIKSVNSLNISSAFRIQYEDREQIIMHTTDRFYPVRGYVVTNFTQEPYEDTNIIKTRREGHWFTNAKTFAKVKRMAKQKK